MAKITLKRGQVVGSADPEHHADCQPLGENDVLVKEYDREARKALKQGMLTPKDAWNRASFLTWNIADMNMGIGGGGTPATEALPSTCWVTRRITFDRIRG